MNASEILIEIKAGKKFTYPATRTPGRFFTIQLDTLSRNSYWNLELVCNNLKAVEQLNDAAALNYIANTIESNSNFQIN